MTNVISPPYFGGGYKKKKKKKYNKLVVKTLIDYLQIEFLFRGVNLPTKDRHIKLQPLGLEIEP